MDTDLERGLPNDPDPEPRFGFRTTQALGLGVGVGVGVGAGAGLGHRLPHPTAADAEAGLGGAGLPQTGGRVRTRSHPPMLIVGDADTGRSGVATVSGPVPSGGSGSTSSGSDELESGRGRELTLRTPVPSESPTRMPYSAHYSYSYGHSASEALYEVGNGPGNGHAQYEYGYGYGNGLNGNLGDAGIDDATSVKDTLIDIGLESGGGNAGAGSLGLQPTQSIGLVWPSFNHVERENFGESDSAPKLTLEASLESLELFRRSHAGRLPPVAQSPSRSRRGSVGHARHAAEPNGIEAISTGAVAEAEAMTETGRRGDATPTLSWVEDGGGAVDVDFDLDLALTVTTEAGVESRRPQLARVRSRSNTVPDSSNIRDEGLPILLPPRPQPGPGPGPGPELQAEANAEANANANAVAHSRTEFHESHLYPYRHDHEDTVIEIGVVKPLPEPVPVPHPQPDAQLHPHLDSDLDTYEYEYAFALDHGHGYDSSDAAAVTEAATETVQSAVEAGRDVDPNHQPQPQPQATKPEAGAGAGADEAQHPRRRPLPLPIYPRGRHLKFDFRSTHGDPHYIGLMGIEIFSSDGRMLNVKRSQVVADPADINVLPEYSHDPRHASNVFDGVSNTRDDLHSWLAPYRGFGKPHTIEVDLGVCDLGMIRIFNFNKSRVHSSRGARDVIISLDGALLFEGELKRAPGSIELPLAVDCSTILLFLDPWSDEGLATLVAIGKADPCIPSYIGKDDGEGSHANTDAGAGGAGIGVSAGSGPAEDERPLTGDANLRGNRDAIDLEIDLEAVIVDRTPVPVPDPEVMHMPMSLSGTETASGPQSGLEDVETGHAERDSGYGYGSECPSGRFITLILEKTWGDRYWIGLTGIAVIDANGAPIPLSVDAITSCPSSIRGIKGAEHDPRTLDKLVDGVNVTTDPHHMWLAPMPSPVSDIKFNADVGKELALPWIRIDLMAGAGAGADNRSGNDDHGSPADARVGIPVSGLRVWNYNQAGIECGPERGVRVMHILLDSVPVTHSNGVMLRKARSGDWAAMDSDSLDDFSQLLRFPPASVIAAAAVEDVYENETDGKTNAETGYADTAGDGEYVKAESESWSELPADQPQDEPGIVAEFLLLGAPNHDFDREDCHGHGSTIGHQYGHHAHQNHGYALDMVQSDYVVPLLPTALSVTLILHDTHGDLDYIGLNGIELCDLRGERIRIRPSQVHSSPRGVDIRAASNLVDGVVKLDQSQGQSQDQVIDRHVFLAPFQRQLPGQAPLPGRSSASAYNTVSIEFDSPQTISALRVWNYTKTVERGVKTLGVYFDGMLGFMGELKPAPGLISSNRDFVQSVLFLSDAVLIQRERDHLCSGSSHSHSFHKNGFRHRVTFVNEGKIVV